jgi:hypothetical protein
LESFLTLSLIRVGSMLGPSFKVSVTEKRILENGSHRIGFRYPVPASREMDFGDRLAMTVLRRWRKDRVPSGVAVLSPALFTQSMR